MHFPVIPPGQESRIFRGESFTRAVDAIHAVRGLDDKDGADSKLTMSRARGHGYLCGRRIREITGG